MLLTEMELDQRKIELTDVSLESTVRFNRHKAQLMIKELEMV